MTDDLESGLRLAIGQAWRRPRAGGLSLAGAFSDAVSDALAVARDLFDLDEFRAAEVAAYDALRSGAISEVQRDAEARLLEAIVLALATFARAHPDAPRPPRRANAG